MKMKEEIFYKEYTRRENEVLRAPYNPELEFYSVIKFGDVEKTRELCKEPLHTKEGMGILSEDPLQNMKYHFTITTAIVARYCIEGGMDLPQAYGLSDFYILKVDKYKTVEDISALHAIMCEDYAKHMKDLRKKKVSSIHIVKCIDYIYDHLHTRITVKLLAKITGVSSPYLSRLFKKETGISISQYIQTCKIETAQNMLIYSEHSLAQISATLAFSSQSYFNEVFKKHTGLTPLEYRSLNLHATRINGMC